MVFSLIIPFLLLICLSDTVLCVSSEAFYVSSEVLCVSSEVLCVPSEVRCFVSPVTCFVSPVMCFVSPVMCFQFWSVHTRKNIKTNVSFMLLQCMWQKPDINTPSFYAAATIDT